MKSSWLRVATAMMAIGWGANQFAAMLLIYRERNGFTEPTVMLMFAVYVLGLMPGLLASAWWSQHVGKRRMMRPAMVLSLFATVLLILGAESQTLLYAGRFAAGLATGAAMGPGTAWIKELSMDAPLGTGARRATIALSTGFGSGPFVAAMVATFLPHPKLLPYLVHLVVMSAALLWAWNTPELDSGDHPTPAVSQVAKVLAKPWFVVGTAIAAPWAFGCTSLSFTTVPAKLAPQLGAYVIPISGLVAGLTLAAGVFFQPTVKRFELRYPGRSMSLGLVLVMLALGASAVTVAFQQPLGLIATVPLFGTAYGTLMVAGLTTLERHVPVYLMAPAAAVFYCLTYIGFFAPWVLSLFAGVPLSTLMLIGVAEAALTLLIVLIEHKVRPEPPA